MASSNSSRSRCAECSGDSITPHIFDGVGQGEIEYGRIVAQLTRHHYNRLLTVDIQDCPDASFVMEPEVRKLKYLLESLN